MFSTSAVALPMLLLATLLSTTSAAGAGAGAGTGSSSAAAAAAAPRPHLVLVLGDDLGFYDTQIYNPTSPTPNLKSLSEQGVRLDRHCECAATRAAAQSAALRADATTDCKLTPRAAAPCRRLSLLLAHAAQHAQRALPQPHHLRPAGWCESLLRLPAARGDLALREAHQRCGNTPFVLFCGNVILY
jgi:hypothetical protein